MEALVELPKMAPQVVPEAQERLHRLLAESALMARVAVEVARLQPERTLVELAVLVAQVLNGMRLMVRAGEVEALEEEVLLEVLRILELEAMVASTVAGEEQVGGLAEPPSEQPEQEPQGLS